MKGMEVKKIQTDLFCSIQRLVICLAPKYTTIGKQSEV